jgi:large subunit ribosomal protein L17
MFNNMVTSLFLHERILTTLERAKELRRIAEKLVTLGKRGDLAARRLAARSLKVQGHREGKRIVVEETALKKLFEIIAPRYKSRQGGYTRIIRTGTRHGDGATMAFIEMLPEEKKAQPKGTTKKAGAKKTAAPKSKGTAAKSTKKSSSSDTKTAKKTTKKKTNKKTTKKTASKTAKKSAKKSTKKSTKSSKKS